MAGAEIARSWPPVNPVPGLPAPAAGGSVPHDPENGEGRNLHPAASALLAA